MSAKAGAGIKRMEAKGLGRGSVDDLPDIEVHAQAEHLEFVDERDVDAAVDVFQQLGHLSRRGRGDGNGAAEDRAVKARRRFRWPAGRARRSPLEYRGGRPGYYPDLRAPARRRPRIRFRWHCRLSRCLEAGLVFFLQNRNQDFFGRAGVGRAFEDDDLAGSQMRRDGMRGIGDVAQVRFVILVQRSGDADDDRVHLADLRIIRRRLEAVGLGGGDLLGRDAENISPAVVERVDLALIDVEAGDRKLLLAVEQGERKPDVAEADDPDARLAGVRCGF